jgi:hypothetical protein
MKKFEFIIAAALYYVGKTEKKGNAGFNDPAFEKELKSVGWYEGAPWCAFFVKLIYKKAYRHHADLLAAVLKDFNGSAMQTYKNCQKSGVFEVGNVPKPGAVVVWAKGAGPSGHEGVVMSVDGNTMYCIEGNTNNHGSRDGDTVAQKPRTVKRDFQKEGLNIIGYIYAKEA